MDVFRVASAIQQHFLVGLPRGALRRILCTWLIRRAQSVVLLVSHEVLFGDCGVLVVGLGRRSAHIVLGALRILKEVKLLTVLLICAAGYDLRLHYL